MESFRNSHLGWYLFCCIFLRCNNMLPWDSRRLTQAAVLPHRVIKMNAVGLFFASQRHWDSSQLPPQLPTYSFGQEEGTSSFIP